MTKKMTRRAALRLLAAGGGVVAAAGSGGYFLRDVFAGQARRPRPPAAAPRALTDAGMMGDRVDMSAYADMFNRHDEIRRSVTEIPGGVRTVTESDSPDLVAQLQEHVSKMYVALNRGSEVTCQSASLPVLFRNADAYERRFVTTAKGVIVTETSADPKVTKAIREHAREVNGFVRDGMQAMMQGMMG